MIGGSCHGDYVICHPGKGRSYSYLSNCFFKYITQHTNIYKTVSPGGVKASDNLLVCFPTLWTFIATVYSSTGQQTEQLGWDGLHQVLPGLGVGGLRYCYVWDHGWHHPAPGPNPQNQPELLHCRYEQLCPNWAKWQPCITFYSCWSK